MIHKLFDKEKNNKFHCECFSDGQNSKENKKIKILTVNGVLIFDFKFRHRQMPSLPVCYPLLQFIGGRERKINEHEEYFLCLLFSTEHPSVDLHH